MDRWMNRLIEFLGMQKFVYIVNQNSVHYVSTCFFLKSKPLRKNVWISKHKSLPKG